MRARADALTENADRHRRPGSRRRALERPVLLANVDIAAAIELAQSVVASSLTRPLSFAKTTRRSAVTIATVRGIDRHDDRSLVGRAFQRDVPAAACLQHRLCAAGLRQNRRGTPRTTFGEDTEPDVTIGSTIAGARQAARRS